MSTTRPPTESNGSVPGDVSRDDVFEVLSNRRRRYTLQYLGQQPNRTADLSAVAEQVAAWEAGVDLDAVEYGDRKSVRVSLHQHHAPKMAEVGVLDYDEGRGTLALTDAAADLEPVLAARAGPTSDADHLDRRGSDPDRETRLAAVAVLSTALVTVGALGVVPGLTRATTTLFAAGLFGGYGCWVLAHRRDRVLDALRRGE